MLPRPPAMRQPRLTQGQARRLAHLKRSGHFVTGFDSIETDDGTVLVFVTSRTEFPVHDDGSDLSADEKALLPARPSSGRRRSLRNPDGNDSQESKDAQQ